MAAHINDGVPWTKDTFYSNHNGTTKADISLVLSINPTSVLLRMSLQMALIAFGFQEGWLLKFLLDFALLNLPLCLSVTLLSGAALQILITQVVLSLSLLFLAVWCKSLERKPESVQDILQTPMSGRQPFITNFRALNNFGVALGILAVDFVVFPRRYAKTETFGTGIMDGGVGVYVLMNAMVSPEARGLFEKSGLKSLVKSVTSSIPLLVLGLGRLATVKGIDYHEHISEYGVYWNFFFTLAATKILCTVLLLFIPVSWSGLVSLSLALVYQYLLGHQGLQDLVLHGTDLRDSRDGFFNANREGLVSSLGYVAIYFAGVRLGQYLLKPRKRALEWLKVFSTLVIADVFLWLLLTGVEGYVSLTSRRLANLPYVIWNVAYSFHILASFLLIDVLFTIINHHFPTESKKEDAPVHTAELILAINRNQLLYFLLANVMTGLVNLTFDTINQSDGTAFFIIVVYLFVLDVVLVVLHRINITTKFW